MRNAFKAPRIDLFVSSNTNVLLEWVRFNHGLKTGQILEKKT